MSSDWDEIRRLASDFQKIQLTSTLQRLSERNCVEVIQLLIEKKLINVVFTNDGKEYITPDYLQKEVEDELYVHGGRVNLVELAQILNVDLTHINGIADRLTKERDDLHLVLGQLVSEEYLQKTATEINEKLAQDGEISVSDLTIQFDLPSEFLLAQVMEKYLGKLIRGRQDAADPRIFFTPGYIARCKAKIRGALVGLTQPTSVLQIIQAIGIQERVFFTLFNEVSAAGILTARQQAARAQYIPSVYTKNQRDWVVSFYRQNSYLEYEAVARLGVSDAKSFIKRTIDTESVTFLSKCCVGRTILDQIESALDECISSASYLDVGSILPSIMSEEDIESSIGSVLTPTKRAQTLLFGTTVLTKDFIDNLLRPCYELIDKNAKQSVDSGKYQLYMAERAMSSTKDVDTNDRKSERKEDRRRKAQGGKGGGGTQGRETKTKSTKKLYRSDRGHQSDSDDESVAVNKQRKAGPSIEIIALDDIKSILVKQLEPEGLGDLDESIAEQYYPSLTKSSLEIAHRLYEASLQTTQNQRQSHASLQTKLNEALVNIRLYEKGLRLLPADIQPQLVKYLLKSNGTDICNDIFLYAAAESGLNFAEASLKPEQRAKIAQDCDQEYKSALNALNKAVSGSSIEDYLQAVENALEACGMILKKVDKKKDRNLILCHKHALLDQLSKCDDPALTLHLAVLVIFTITTQCMLHASGKFVSSILSYLQPSLSAEQSAVLTSFHDAVLKLLTTTSSESDETKGRDSEELYAKMGEVKAIASTFKKSGTSAVE